MRDESRDRQVILGILTTTSFSLSVRSTRNNLTGARVIQARGSAGLMQTVTRRPLIYVCSFACFFSDSPISAATLWPVLQYDAPAAR